MGLSAEQEEAVSLVVCEMQLACAYDLICYGQHTVDWTVFDARLDDIVSRRVGPGLWPTRDTGGSDAEC